MVFLQGEVSRLKKSLESKIDEFNYLAAQYQEASAAAASASLEVKELQIEVASLRRKLEIDVKAITWESEKKGLLDKIKSLEAKCNLLEERERRVLKKQGNVVTE